MEDKKDSHDTANKSKLIIEQIFLIIRKSVILPLNNDWWII